MHRIRVRWEQKWQTFNGKSQEKKIDDENWQIFQNEHLSSLVGHFFAMNMPYQYREQ